jgi:hypothetical protein
VISGFHFGEQRSPFSQKYEKTHPKSRKMLLFQRFRGFLDGILADLGDQPGSFTISPSNSRTFSCEQANSFSHFRPSPRTAVFIFGRTAVAIFAGTRDQP